MRFDDITIKMLNAFIDNEELTSTDLTKIVFKPKNRNSLQTKNNLIIGRLKTWISKGLISNGTCDDRIAHYRLNQESIKLGRLFLFIDDNDIEELGDYLVMDVNGKDRIIAPLNDE